MLMIVERATEDDLIDVLAIDAAHMGEQAAQARRSQLVRAVSARECYIVRDQWDVLGYAILTRHFFGYPFIDLLIVHPDQRRKGAASALIEHIESVCPGDKLFTSTNESNAPMHGLMARLGFVKSGWIDNLDPGDPEIVYFKALLPA